MNAHAARSQLSGEAMQASIGCADHIGGRDEQQDRVAAQVMGDSALLVVADGMGGHQDGAAAARLLVDTALRLHRENQGRIADPEHFFKQVVRAAWEAIRDHGRRHGASAHTVAVMALVRADGWAFWAHLGDSRLYRLADGRPAWRTRDHSVVQLLAMEGEISEEEIASHPDQNRLWRSIGGDRHHDPSVGGSGEPLTPGELLLLCSDGLWEQVQPVEAARLAAAMPPPEAASALAALAAQRGGAGGDNVSCALWVTPWFFAGSAGAGVQRARVRPTE